VQALEQAEPAQLLGLAQYLAYTWLGDTQHAAGASDAAAADYGAEDFKVSVLQRVFGHGALEPAGWFR
jgi:hypothetical protein